MSVDETMNDGLFVYIGVGIACYKNEKIRTVMTIRAGWAGLAQI